MAGGEILEEMERNIERMSVCTDKNVSFTMTQEDSANAKMSGGSLASEILSYNAIIRDG
jgi:hypothetical protein